LYGNYNHYQIESEIGRSRLAVVYQAYDPTAERQVVIKLLYHHLSSDEMGGLWFQRETQILCKILKHPFIVPIYDFGQYEAQPFTVTRLMTGGSLADRLRQGPLSLSEIATIIERIGAALADAQNLGVLHHDLKPSNILFDEKGDAFVTDFCSTKMAHNCYTELRSEEITRSPAYMSPEQIRNDSLLDQRSDLYALGVMVFEALTGEAPYQADSPIKVMLKHIMDPIPSILSVKPDLPPACERLIKRALAKKADDRYATAKELAAALGQIAAGSTCERS
jgi:serine/threonine protein kinase